ncbi:MAG TPA: BamA/TamA family outer membrane protein, partial [Gemmatimonadales bacterium]
VINGDLIVDPGGTVSGDVLVVGGQIIVRPGGSLDGRRLAFRQPAYLVRTGSGLLAVREPARTLGDLASARARFTTGRFENTLSIETGRTYNRVEGLPIVFGPTVVRTGLPNVEARLDLRAIAWTAPDRTDRRSDFGYSGRLEFHFGQARRLTIGSNVSRLISPIEDQPLSRAEVGWSSLLFQRDYRDFYESEGLSGYASYDLGGGVRLGTSVGRYAERSIPANDPISILRNEAWRPNPLVDDGHYLTWRVGVDYDTRNDAEGPSDGWLVNGWWEQSRSNDASALSFPGEVRDPIPPGRYQFSRFWLDARRYARLDPGVRAAARVVAGGWLSGDPLPVQRRFSIGGPDFLPGYGFREFNCAPPSRTDPARTGLCDRLLGVQLEVRTQARIGLPIATVDPYLTAVQRLLSIREPDVVVFADAGKAWVTGEGPGRVPNGKIPNFGEWGTDIGFGFDAGGLGLYLSQPLTRGRPLTLTVRLQRRF